MHRFLIIILFVFMTAGCTKAQPVDTNGIDNSNLNTAVPLPHADVTEDGNLSLSKDALGKEFLLQASFIDEGGEIVVASPTSFGTQSRIVSFVKQKKSLFMMESTKGLLASDELPAERILAEFPILKEEGETLTFDFNEGMNKIFMTGDWYASDAGRNLSPLHVVSILHSFLKEVENQKNRILIRQIAQIANGGGKVLPVEVVYYFEPYRSNPNFQPVLSPPNLDRVGFFETNPTVREEFGSLQTFITKWDTGKPVLFAISANTPEEYRDAVKEGVLYWNKVFGREVLQVKMAPKEIRAPNPDYNIIQWVTNHAANPAYADAQMDPRTGEILHAQIYFTTVWTVRTLDALAREKKEEASKPDENSILGLRGFGSGLLCQYPALENLQAAEGDETVTLKLTKDQVRLVIAHEMGHALGLRHNFAGSAYSELKPDAISETFNKYLQTGVLENSKPVSSSVMDYLGKKEDILTGALIGASDSQPLPYDAMAIHWGYDAAALSDDFSKVLFCAGNQFGVYADCQARDGSSNPLLVTASDFSQSVAALPKKIARYYLEAKSYFDPQGRIAVEEVGLDAGTFAGKMTRPLLDFIGLLKGEGRFLFIERKLPAMTDVNARETEKVTMRWMDSAIRSGGGIQKLLEGIFTHQIYDAFHDFPVQFNAIVDKPGYREGKTILGEPYNFTEGEIKWMKKNAASFFDLLQIKLAEQITVALVDKKSVDNNETPIPFQNIADLKALEATYAQWAEFIITDGAEKTPTFEGVLRLFAIKILNPAQGPTPDWEQANRLHILEVLKKKLEQRYGVSFDKVNPQTLSEKEKASYQLEQAIVQSLQGP